MIDWKLLEKAVEASVKAHLRESANSIRGDLQEYSERLSRNLAYCAKLKTQGETVKYETAMRHLRAQARSLQTITTIREAKRLEKTFWSAMKMLLKVVVTAAVAAA